MIAEAVPVITYHSIGAADGGPVEPYRTPLSDFANHVDAMQASGRSWVTIRELAHRLAAGHEVSGLAAVTFDDVFADAVEHAIPLLVSAGIPATLYTVSSTMRGKNWSAPGVPALASPDELRDLDDSIEIGSHSIDHPQLDCVSAAESLRQIQTSRDRLQAVIGTSIDTFAYPHGYRSRRVRRQVAEAGYVGACGVGDAFSHRDDDRFSIARVLIERSMSVDVVARLIAGHDRDLAPARDRARTTVWRCVRRARAGLGR